MTFTQVVAGLLLVWIVAIPALVVLARLRRAAGTHTPSPQPPPDDSCHEPGRRHPRPVGTEVPAASEHHSAGSDHPAAH